MAATTSGPRATPDALLRRLEWRVLRRLEGRIQGDYRTLLHGAGLDVAELREYEYGDDVRHIDWNVTARTDITHVRTFVEDRELTAWLLLDRSGSMGFGPSDRPKEHVLVELSAVLARLLSRNGNRVGAVLFDNTIEQTIPPRTGRNQVLHLTRELQRPPANHGTSTQLGVLLESALRTIRKPSLVILVSDFLTDTGWERPLAMLAQRHDVVAIRLTDPREHDLPDAGLVVVEDAETGELLSVDTSDSAFRQRFAQLADEREAEIRATARRSGVELFPVSTEDDLVDALVRIVEIRRRNRR
jgi:uncharacterized protein (DUF58 family)